MKCPNCQNRLTEETYDNQPVLHCDRCAASFFDQNGINRISEESAQQLATEISEPIVLGGQKHCPKDKATLQTYTSESVPPDVTLLTCPLCSGVLAYPDDLVKFKAAQDAKITFFKLWGQPIPNLSAVLVLSLVLVVSVSTLVGMTFYVGQSAVTTSASDLVKNLTVIQSGRYTLLSFQTTRPVTAHISLEDTSTGKEEILTVSSTPKTFHTLTTTTVDPSHIYMYTITLTEESGRETSTEKKQL